MKKQIALQIALEALHEIVRRAPEEEPEYSDWGGDTEDAEVWGQSAGLWEAAQIARAAIKEVDRAL